jgi:hypothetical protein
MKAQPLPHFGRRMFFTYLNWSAEVMVQTHEERTEIEEDFRWMTGDDEMSPLSPFFVRTDASTLTHAFMMVMGMLLLPLTWKRIQELGFLQGGPRILEAMDGLDPVLLSRQSRGELRGGTWRLADPCPLVDELRRELELDGEVAA